MALNGGIIGQSSKAAFKTEIATIKEQLEIEKANAKLGQEVFNSEELSDKLIPDRYKNVLAITPNGELVLMNTPEGRAYIELWGEVTIINTEEDLKNFRDEVNNGRTFGGEIVFLTSDINLNIAEEWEPIGKFCGKVESEEANINVPFKGIFDGGGHEINGMKIDSPESGRGFFGMAQDATIMNLVIEENNIISSSGDVVGSVCAYADRSAVVGCTNKGDMCGSRGVGGIVRCRRKKVDNIKMR